MGRLPYIWPMGGPCVVGLSCPILARLPPFSSLSLVFFFLLSNDDSQSNDSKIGPPTLRTNGGHKLLRLATPLASDEYQRNETTSTYLSNSEFEAKPTKLSSFAYILRTEVPQELPSPRKRNLTSH